MQCVELYVFNNSPLGSEIKVSTSLTSIYLHTVQYQYRAMGGGIPSTIGKSSLGRLPQQLLAATYFGTGQTVCLLMCARASASIQFSAVAAFFSF
jgi:hypothetical protein